MDWTIYLVSIISYFIGLGIGTYFTSRRKDKFYMSIIDRLPEFMRKSVKEEIVKKD